MHKKEYINQMREWGMNTFRKSPVIHRARQVAKSQCIGSRRLQ